MVDFRKLTSPKTQRIIALENEELIAFQNMSDKEMADRLLLSSRALIDSGRFKGRETERWQSYSYDEAALYRLIPQIAKRLDPDVVLRTLEHSLPEEARDSVTYLEGAPVGKIVGHVRSTLSHCNFMRATMRDDDTPEHVFELRRHVAFLLGAGGSVSALSLAVDRLDPGCFPQRAHPDQREPLSGTWVVVSTAWNDRTLAYCETIAGGEALFEKAVAVARGDDVALTEELQDQRLKRWRDYLVQGGEIKLVTADNASLRSWEIPLCEPVRPDDAPGDAQESSTPDMSP